MKTRDKMCSLSQNYTLYLLFRIQQNGAVVLLTFLAFQFCLCSTASLTSDHFVIQARYFTRTVVLFDDTVVNSRD